MDIGERIKRRRKELGLSVDEIAALLNKNRATVYRYESNFIKDLPLTILESLAQVLQTTPAYLMGWDGYNTSKDRCTETNEILLAVKKNVPLVDSIVGGELKFADKNLTIDVPSDEKYVADFAYIITDDSMLGANILKDSAVFIVSCGKIKNNDIVLISLDGELILRRISYDADHIKLWPENSTYKAIIIPNKNEDKFTIVGKAMAYYNMLD